MKRYIQEWLFAEEMLLEMHPSVRRAFEQGSHPLGKHPVFQKHGQKMSADQFGHLSSQYQTRTGKARLDPRDIFETVHEIQRREAQHAEQLERLAIAIVAKVWKIDPSLIGNASITDDLSVEDDKSEPVDDTPLTPQQAEEVEKRITMNMLTHGSSLHMMTTMYHLAKETLDQIDPQLVKLYDRFSTGSALSTWHLDIEQMLKMAGIRKGGQEKVEWQNGKPKIDARAEMFPLLLHELSKGVMELLTMHQLSSLEPETLKKVYKHADRYEHEFFHFFVGPAVWRKFLKAVPQDKLARVVAALSRLKSKEVTAFINAVIEDPQMATQMVANLVRDPKGTVEDL